MEDSFRTPESPAKKGRRGVKKKVISVSLPMKSESSGHSSSGNTTPPSDSWAWRKYGQKPIKGSPYPRAYYRCSSSKGCPVRKQIERSRLDPTMIVVTYSGEHNHSGPTSKNKDRGEPSKPDSPENLHVQPEPEDKFVDVGDESLITGDDFGWFNEASATVLGTSIFSDGSAVGDSGDVAMVFSMAEDDESLFADLGELPECGTVFGRGFPVKGQPPHRRITGTTM